MQIFQPGSGTSSFTVAAPKKGPGSCQEDAVDVVLALDLERNKLFYSIVPQQEVASPSSWTELDKIDVKGLRTLIDDAFFLAKKPPPARHSVKERNLSKQDQYDLLIKGEYKMLASSSKFKNIMGIPSVSTPAWLPQQEGEGATVRARVVPRKEKFQW